MMMPWNAGINTVATMALLQQILPDTPRDFPGRRITRSILRTVHILGGGVLIGAYLFTQPESIIKVWYFTAVLSRLLLFLTDLHASFAVFFEWRGLSILTKIGLLLVMPLIPGMEVYILAFILAIGAISSHLSRNFRHRLWWILPGIVQDQRRG
jgi:hypothetical protein